MNKQKGFAHVITVALVVVLVGTAGYLVIKRQKNNAGNDTNSSNSLMSPEQAQSDNKEVAQNLNQNIGEIGGKGGPNAESGSKTRTYTSPYDNFSFTYPTSYTEKVFSDDPSSPAISITNSEQTIVISYGVPVDPHGAAADCSVGTTMKVYAVEKLDDAGVSRQLYLISYYWDETDSGEVIKAAAVTDWEGNEPKVGVSDMCDYMPSFVSKEDTVLAWFRISDLSEGLRKKDMSVDEFFKRDDVTEALNILRSGKY